MLYLCRTIKRKTGQAVAHPFGLVLDYLYFYGNFQVANYENDFRFFNLSFHNLFLLIVSPTLFKVFGFPFLLTLQRYNTYKDIYLLSIFLPKPLGRMRWRLFIGLCSFIRVPFSHQLLFIPTIFLFQMSA